MSPWNSGGAGIPCLVADVVLRGPFVEYILETEAAERIIAVQSKKDDPVALGTNMLISWDPTRCHVFSAGR